MALSVVTFNIGGDGRRHEGKKMINKFLEDQPNLPSILFLQENTWRSDKIKEHVPSIGKNYETVSHKNSDATVLYRKDVLKDEGSTLLEESMKDAFEGRAHLDFKTFKARASFSKLTEIETSRSFVAISWHGEHKEKKKKEKFEDLLLVIKEINSKTIFPVILGGDFNITLDSVSDSIEEQGLEVYEYELENRDTVIDFFVVTNDVQLTDVQAFGGYMYINDKDTEKEIQVFDHDPVEAMISFVELDEAGEQEGKKYTEDQGKLDDLASNLSKTLKVKVV